MKKRRITTAAFLAGVTTLSVSLPAMAETHEYEASMAATSTQVDVDFINGEDFDWVSDSKNDA